MSAPITYRGPEDGLFFWRCAKCGAERIPTPPKMPNEPCPALEPGGKLCGGQYDARVLRAARSKP